MTAEVVIRNTRPYRPVQHYRDNSFRHITADEMLPPSVLAEVILQTKRDPSWRWTAAKRIKENTSHPDDFQPRRSHDALVVNHVYPFLYDYDSKTRTMAGEDEVKEKWPGLAWAHDIYRNGGIYENYIQAMLLGGAPLAEIAKCLVVTENQVWWYAKVWFDVEPYRADKYWVWVNVLEQSLHHIGKAHVEDFLWKAMAYEQGWEIFQGSFGFGMQLTPEWRGTMLNALNRKVIQDTLLTVIRREPNSYNEQFIVDQYLKLVELDVQQGPRDEKKEQNIKVLMDMISNSFEMAKLGSMDSGVEPRASDELVKVYQQRALQIQKPTTVKQEAENAGKPSF